MKKPVAPISTNEIRGTAARMGAAATLSTGTQIIRSKNGFVAMRVSTLMTTDQEAQIQVGVDAIERTVEAEFEKLASRVLRVEMRKR
jgi:hypothetical protein